MRKLSRIVLTLSLLLVLTLWSAPPTFAQTGGTQVNITQVDNSQFPQVTVYVSVTDVSGQPVGVDPSAIQISENGQVMQPINVSGGGQGGIGPLTTMLVMDVSGSMDKNGKINGAKAAAKAYVDQMRPEDQAGLMVYNTRVNYAQPLTTDHTVLNTAIDGIKTGGDTAMYDALIAAEEALKDVAGRKAVIVVTDGLDNSSSSNATDVIAGIGPSGLSISTIGLGDASTRSQQGLDEAGLKSLAQQAGGAYSYAGDPNALSALFQLYGRALQNEYEITYVSPSSLRDGVNRSLTVSLTNVAVSANSQYNPGGVLPEVGTQSWPLFAGILVALLALLAVPMLVGRGLQAIGGGGSGFRKKGRVKLGETPSSSAKGRVKIR